MSFGSEVCAALHANALALCAIRWAELSDPVMISPYRLYLIGDCRQSAHQTLSASMFRNGRKEEEKYISLIGLLPLHVRSKLLLCKITITKHCRTYHWKVFI